MGDWNTLHVFDDRRFHEEVVPMLQGRKVGIEAHYQRFLSVRPRCDIRIDELVPVFRQFSADFTRHPGYEALLAQDPGATFARIHPEEFYIRRFFEFVVFSECASFFPYFKMGYRLFGGAVGAKEGSVEAELVSRIAHGNADNPWRWDGDGIRSWMSAEEVELLLLDSGSVVPRGADDAEYVQDFLRFLGVVTKNALGLLSAVNIHDPDLKDCAPPLQDKDLWTGVEIGNLIRKE